MATAPPVALPSASWHPETITVSLGMKQLAYAHCANAFTDAQGRGLARRQNACDAILWLRDMSTDEPFSLRWCALLLGMDAHLLAYDGFARIPRSGLRHWREWQSTRNRNRIERLPRITKTCPQCGSTFTTKHDKTYCSQSCAHQAQVRPNPLVYSHTCAYCNQTFSNRRAESVYCSVKCRVDDQRQERYDCYQQVLEAQNRHRVPSGCSI